MVFFIFVQNRIHTSILATCDKIHSLRMSPSWKSNHSSKSVFCNTSAKIMDEVYLRFPVDACISDTTTVLPVIQVTAEVRISKIEYLPPGIGCYPSNRAPMILHTHLF